MVFYLVMLSYMKNTKEASLSMDTRVKLYHDEEQINELTTKEIHLMCELGKMEDIPIMALFPANYHETMPWVTEKPFIYNVVGNICNEAKMYDLGETGEGIVKGNFLYVKKDPTKPYPSLSLLVGCQLSRMMVVMWEILMNFVKVASSMSFDILLYDDHRSEVDRVLIMEKNSDGIFPVFFEKLGIRLSVTSLYHPQANGRVGVTNRDIVKVRNEDSGEATKDG
nr:hypothetical protein [Tanacetum cinerariifolium]